MTIELGGRGIVDLGIAYEVDVQAQTGAAVLRVPVPAPPGRSGFGPAFTLTYSSGAGSSAFGAGWSLDGLPSIGIDTRRHVPRWDGRDGYALGGEALVPWLEPEGAPAWQPRRWTQGAYTVALYRLRVGGAALRAEKWTHTGTGRVHWRTRDAQNVLTIYGARLGAAARIADPEDEARTYTWLPELRIDAHGNAMWLEYAAETPGGVDRTALFEQRRPALAQRYLKRVRYGNVQPLAVTDALVAGERPADVRWCFQLVFDHGDHADSELPGAEADRAWPARPDAFSSFRAGFEIRTYRLCRRILAFHDIPELGDTPTLVGALVLDHDLDPAGATLGAIRYVGYRRDASGVRHKELPPLRMRYAPPATATAFATVPAETRENLPAGLSGAGTVFVDLLGEGLPGILTESERAWLYKPNLGNGRFGAQALVLERPATRPGSHVFGDVDRNGDPDLAQLAGRMAGRFELDRGTGQWRPFQPFAQLPHVEALGGRAQWVNLDGDGRPEIVVDQGDRLLWYRASESGFDAPVTVPRPAGARAVPMLGEDPALGFFFADMSGDGLADQVRVQNGRVEYWPNLGNGRFGDGIALEGAPRFAPAGEFDSRRLRFVDIDGSGTADLVYLGQGEVTVWINAAGNQLVPGPHLRGLPYFDNLSTVRVLDFLGDGRPCLVWSSPLPGRASPIQYLPLAPADPPRLLLAVDDALGQETRLAYSSSAAHYLRDSREGRGWSTRLPHHVPVVDRREVIDAIGHTRSVQRFVYHDGHFDGHERVFRGFGQVDVYEAEAADGTEPGPGAAAFASPALTRTWFHLGTRPWDHHRPADLYAGHAALPALGPHAIEPAAMAPAELDDAYRALAGRVVRRETYAVDEHGRAAEHPFEVMQARHEVRRAQPVHVGAEAAFFVLPAEELTAVYEQAAGDPRVSHRVVLEIDAFDQIVRDADISYARRPGQDVDMAAQAEHTITIHEHGLVHIDEVERFELGIPVEGKDFELTGLTPGPSGLFTRAQLADAAVHAALAQPLGHDEPVPAGDVAARLLSWERSFYWNDDRTAALPHGEIGSRVLVHHEEAACFAPALIHDVFGVLVDEARLASLGYVLRDGLWWQPDAIHHFGGPELFHQREAIERIDGGVMQLEYDAYALELVAIVDAAGNRTEAVIDYHVLAPWRIVDANGTTSEALYDPLGVLVAETTCGDVDGQPWGFAPLHTSPGTGGPPLDAPVGADTAPLDAPTADTGLDPGTGDTPPQPGAPAAPDAAAVMTDPAGFLGNAARRVFYDLDTWAREGTPPVILTLAREELLHDGHGGGTADGRIQIGVTYLDGMGRALQSKVRVEPGPAIQRDADGAVVVDAGGRPELVDSDERWQVSGHVVYDAAQRPGREFEPFFSPAWAYESDPELAYFGVSTLIRYDALGREVGRDLPDGTFTRATYHAWSVEHADANDTVLDSAYRALREGLPADHPEKQALEHAKSHAGTVSLTFLDPRGREAGALARGGDTHDRRSESRLDALGQPREIRDPRGLVAFTYRRDMQGRALYSHSVDAGEARILPDALGRPALSWDARGIEIEHGHDILDRPTTTHVRGPGLDHRVEERIYGESVADAAARNLRGQLAILRDPAGEITILRCDPAGQVLASTQQLRADVDTEPDWRAPVPLEDELFASEATYDALGRPRQATLPDGTVRKTSYLRGGGIARLQVSTHDGQLEDLPIVDSAAYDARGQRVCTALGNGVELTYAYDEHTARLSQQIARRGARKLQDIAYTYDPAGNLVRIEDHAHEPGPDAIIRGTSIPARRDYSYDAHYRLVRATGRVHQALLEHDHIPALGGPFKGTRHITLDNGAALERFTRTYTYDASGNLQRLRHTGASQSWTTDFWISATSNRSLPAHDAGGSPIVDPEERFDAAGHLTWQAHLRRMVWSWRGTLSRAVLIERPGGTDDAEVYVYGAEHQRVRKLTTRVVHDGQIEVTEKIYLGACERTRVRRGGTILLERWTSHLSDDSGRVALLHRWVKDELGRETDDITQHRIHYQLNTHQGSAALELDAGGQIISYEEYFPFGGSAFIAGDHAREVALKEYRYTGKERDDATGLYYFGYRYYAPWMARWLSPDPIGPADDLNLYQFVLGDPVGNVDPDGLETDPRSRGPGRLRRGGVEATPADFPQDAVPGVYYRKEEGAWVGYTIEQLEAMGTDVVLKDYVDLRQRAVDQTRRQVESLMAAGAEAGSPGQEISPFTMPDLQAYLAGGTSGSGGGMGAGSETGTGADGNTDTGSTTDSGGEGSGDGFAASAEDALSGAGDGRTPGSDPAAGTRITSGTTRDLSRTGAGQRGQRTGGTGHTGTGPGAGQRGIGHGATPGISAPDAMSLLPGPGIVPGAGTGSGAGMGEGAGEGSTSSSEGSGKKRTGKGLGTGQGHGQPPQTGTGRATVDTTGELGGTGTANGGTTTPGLDASREATATPPGLRPGGIEPNGGIDGSRHGTRGASGKEAGNLAGAGLATGTAEHGTAGGQAGGGADGSARGLAGYEPSWLDTAARWAGYANFEFGDDRPPGQRGGVPGGTGRTNLGWFGKALYIGLTALTWASPAALLKGLRAGLRRGLGLLARGARIGVRSLARGLGAARRAAVTLLRGAARAISRSGSARLGRNASRGAGEGARFIANTAGRTIDLRTFQGLTRNAETVSVGRSGAGRALTGPANSYSVTSGGHALVYGPEGRLLYDVSASRIKAFQWSPAPSGEWFARTGSNLKFNEVPQAVLNALGL